MLNELFQPSCASYQVRTYSHATGDTVVWPERPLGELNGPRVRKMLACGELVGIALYHNTAKHIYEYRQWLECILKINLSIKILPSAKFQKVSSALLIPCTGPIVHRGAR